MNKQGKTLLLAAVFVVFVAGALILYRVLSPRFTPETELETAKTASPQESGDSEATDRTKAPDFTVVDQNGQSVKLSAMEGKPVVLNFWASWCPPCKSEMPDFQEVFEEMGGDVTFMMVNLTDGQRETENTAADYVKGQGFTFPIYFDTKQEAADAYGISSIPTTIFIDKDGYIVTGAETMLSKSVLKKGISMIQ